MLLIRSKFISAGRGGITLLLLVLALLQADTVCAQQQADTANKVKIIIANVGAIEHFKTDSGSFNKFLTDVVVYQGTDTLYCDSLYQYIESRKLEAFSNVRIVQQGGTEGTSDFLRYASEKKLAFMTGNVGLTDGGNKLRCEEFTYDLGAKSGVYSKGGTLQSDSTTVSSESGFYNVRTHDARFTGNVHVNDPAYKITSTDLGYNTETKVETFYGRSTVTSDSGRSVLTTTRGTYDSKNVVARFTGHSSIWNDGQYIEADTMHYDKFTGYGYAIGNVISIDTAQHSKIYCGRADFFRKQRVLWAIIKPVVELATGKDTFYMRADTFYSAPMVWMRGTQFRMPVDTEDVHSSIDSSGTDSTIVVPAGKVVKAKQQEKSKGIALNKKEEKDTVAVSHKSRHRKAKPVVDTVVSVVDEEEEPVIDSMWAVPPKKYRLADFVKDTTFDKSTKGIKQGKKLKSLAVARQEMPSGDTTAPIYFAGYHHVLIFSDSMQARCDSVCLTRSDSLIRMMYHPVAWTRGSQIMGDTILMQLDSSSIRTMYVPDNSFLVSRSGPEKAKLFDQIQGQTLTAYFKDNNIKKMIVYPDAQSIYYSKDDGGAYVGLSEANSELMKVFFGEESISKIKYIRNVHQTMTPMDQADLPNAKLSRFKWLYDERPASKEELFR